MEKQSWFIKLVIVMAGTIGFISCTQDKWPGGSEIAITWELISNTYSDQPAVKAEFVFENKSNLTLDAHNWQLFFNQSPRRVLAVNEESNVEVERINGDWYRIYPREGFLLPPGEKLSIIYESSHWWIKESDAPMGLYFVFNDDTGDESIVVAENYRMLPFEREEQYTRHRADFEPFPSPEWSFNENKKLNLLAADQLLPIVPSPFSVSRNGEFVSFDSPITIFHQQGLEFEAGFLWDQFKSICKCDLLMQTGFSGAASAIDLKIDNLMVNGQNKEVYRLEINPDGNVSITGSDKAGVFYGVQSLIALVDPAAAFSEKEFTLPVIVVEDVPRFGYRGVHIDVARNFHTKESLMKIMDILAFYKINTLHLHLTEDEGWRLEIKALPELTSVGAQRGHTTMAAAAVHPAYGSGPFPNAKGSYGSGFYSQQDYIEILQHATKRHIRVIPEINMPGHSRAAIKAMEARYSYFMEQGLEDEANEYRLIDPEETSVYLSAQLFTDNVVNVARESVYRFFETVIDEVIDMYAKAGAPLEIIHVGGDEVPAGAWTQSPMITQKMKEIPHITRPANMHAYFTERTLEILGKRNLKMAGWEEVALMQDNNGQHIPIDRFANGDLIPFIWNNLWGAQDLAYRMANRGFPVVLNHVTAFYFDLAYNNDPQEPGLYWAGFVNTRNAWHYNPYDVFKVTTKDAMGRQVDIETEYQSMERLKPEARENILGLQAQMWSETILGQQMLEYYLLPKLIGFAESAWARERVWETTPDASLRQEQVDMEWNVFANTLAQRELPRLAHLFGGYNYRIPLPGAIIEDGVLKANAEFPGLEIRYTLDGSEPVLKSPLYLEPVAVDTAEVKLVAFDISGRHSRTITLK
jgi:hexosaminidase